MFANNIGKIYDCGESFKAHRLAQKYRSCIASAMAHSAPSGITEDIKNLNVSDFGTIQSFTNTLSSVGEAHCRHIQSGYFGPSDMMLEEMMITIKLT